MAEFSTVTRFLAAIVLLICSAIAWRWLQAPASAKLATTTAATDKKRSKKKKTKKKKTDPEPQEEEKQPLKPTAVESAASSAPASDSDEDSDDEDAGLTAKQILAKRRFKPKALGGVSVPTPVPGLVRFQADQRVVARFEDGRDWFPGTILEVRRGNEYHIKYDDGAVEYHVPHARIKDAAAAASEAEKRPQRATKRPPTGAESGLDPRLTVDSGRSEADDEAEAAGNDADSSSEDDDGQDSEDGWQVVGAAELAAKKRRAAAAAAAGGDDGEKVDADGLTKRQRESRRKKERKKELKEMVRAQNQEQGLHARWGGTMTRLKYVPPPTAP